MTNICIDELLVKVRNLRVKIKQNVIYSDNKLIALNKVSELEYVLSKCKCHIDVRNQYEP